MFIHERICIALLLINVIFAAKHHMFVGTFGTKFIYSVEFDDVNLKLKLVNNITTAHTHNWLTLSHDKKNLYGAGDAGWTSYPITSPTELGAEVLVPITSECNSNRGIFILGSSKPPYNVYGDNFGDCTNVISVDDKGSLKAVAQHISYLNKSGVHGTGFDATEEYFYSADDKANSIWTHKRDPSTGLLTHVGTLSAPWPKADPRHLTVHPSGKFMYVLFEGTNQVAQYNIDPVTRQPVFKNVYFPLIHKDANPRTTFWSDDVALSRSNKVLWGTSRNRNATYPGYISAFSLTPEGEIISQLFLTPTTTSGGPANAPAPAPWSDDLVAITDAEIGGVEMWKLEDFQGSSKEGAAKKVAGLRLEDKHLAALMTGPSGRTGCCANAVWVD